MTVELDIVERKNEENLKLSKQMEDTVKKLIMEQGEPIAPIKPAINDAEYELANWVPPTPPTDIQRFYTGKNIFITGGTGTFHKEKFHKLLCDEHTTKIMHTRENSANVLLNLTNDSMILITFTLCFLSNGKNKNATKRFLCVPIPKSIFQTAFHVNG